MRASDTAAEALASYATALTLEDIPAHVRRVARDIVADTVGACVYGHAAPAGRIIVQHVRREVGPCSVLGAGFAVTAEAAALANGTLAHALELDSLRKPGAGVHPGAVLVPAALAVAQQEGSDGNALIAAIVAGCEVLFRIGRATRHSPEARGFHAPGLTGPFGAAVSAGHLLGLDAHAMRNAIGIAGSLSAGLLEFAAAGEGGMVKRLHLGRAAAAGITAARLAQSGFTGPSSVLEGKHGFLHAYCLERDPGALTHGLGTEWQTPTTCFKAYACHITAHTPVHACRTLRELHRFSGRDVATVRVDGTPKMAALHGNREPQDGVAAQYSIAFCVAAALLHDPGDPATFTITLSDPAVRDLCRKIDVTGDGGLASSWATRTLIRLHDGREFELELDEVPGFPTLPFDAAQRRAKFLALTQRLGPAAEALFDRLTAIETEPDLAWLEAAPWSPHVDAEIDGVCKTYGAYRALDHLSLRVEEGEIVVLLGASGCGKTTLLRTIAGFIQPDEGTVRIGGQLVASPTVMVPPERRRLSMVFQSYAVWPHKTVFENLAYGLRLKRMPDAEMRGRIGQALGLVRMDAYAGRYPAELSGGQQQRVALARALVLEPQLLLFDEPLSNLDAGLREHMRFEIKSMLKQLGITGVYVTHDQNEAMVVGDRIAVMAQGRIEQVGTAEEIYYDSRTEFVAGFVGLANVLEAEVLGPAQPGFLRVQVPGLGEVLSRALEGSPLHGPARLFIRPESIAFVADAPGANTVHGQVRRRAFLGATTDFLVDVDGTQLRVMSSSDAPGQPTGTDAVLHLRPDRCLVLAA